MVAPRSMHSSPHRWMHRVLRRFAPALPVHLVTLTIHCAREWLTCDVRRVATLMCPLLFMRNLSLALALSRAPCTLIHLFLFRVALAPLIGIDLWIRGHPVTGTLVSRSLCMPSFHFRCCLDPKQTCTMTRSRRVPWPSRCMRPGDLGAYISCSLSTLLAHQYYHCHMPSLSVTPAAPVHIGHALTPPVPSSFAVPAYLPIVSSAPRSHEFQFLAHPASNLPRSLGLRGCTGVLERNRHWRFARRSRSWGCVECKCRWAL
jgi:hypothetical protein